MSVTAAKGFVASGVAAGIKDTGSRDLALVATADRRSVPAAATFTSNGAAAAPVRLSRAHLVASGGRAGAVVLNSGCANAATGPTGDTRAAATAAAVAGALGLVPEEVLVCSTGLIGVPLELGRIEDALGGLVATLGSTTADGDRAADAILTTDTHAKQTVHESRGVVVGGMVKGAGMIAPNMATMLAVLTTDAVVDSDELARALRVAVGDTFNQLTVDGCTSTNDTVVCLASGASGTSVPPGVLEELLFRACGDLAEQLAEDAEGTTKVVRITVAGAESIEDARRAARRCAESLLVKTSLYGADPYWGRVLSELGSSGARFELAATTVAYGGITVCEHGTGVRIGDADTAELAAHMAGRRVEIRCDLGVGDAEASVLSTDLGHGYIDENMGTS